jgi:hypothetical protein
MRRQKQPIAFGKLVLPRFAFDEDARGSGHDQNPLVILLIVPLSFRCRLAGRDDPLDAKVRAPVERLDTFPGKGPRRKAAYQASGLHPHRLGRLDAL